MAFCESINSGMPPSRDDASRKMHLLYLTACFLLRCSSIDYCRYHTTVVLIAFSELASPSSVLASPGYHRADHAARLRRLFYCLYGTVCAVFLSWCLLVPVRPLLSEIDAESHPRVERGFESNPARGHG